MNITLPCRGSKREQARPPICAARRRAHRRAGCRGDQTNAALNARIRPNRPHGYRCRGILFLSPLPSWRRTTSSRRRRFFLSVVGELGFHYVAVNAPSSLSRVDVVERRPCAQWSPPGLVSQPMIRSALFSVLTDIGTPSSLNVRQVAISVALSALSASVSHQAQPSRPPKSSSTR
jgi:hypothetical protein